MSKPSPRAQSPPLRTAAGSIAADVANSVRQNWVPPPGMPRHGLEKGSYLSPFDYNTRDKIKTASAEKSDPLFSPTTDPGFVAFAARAQSGKPTVNAQGANTSELPKEGVKISPPRAVTPGPNARPRLLLLAPLRMIRHTACSLRSDDRAMLFNFIDSYMADSLHTVVERDPIIPSIIYKISIPMTDENWSKYIQVLTVFGHAKAVHEMLAAGSDEFDKYTMRADPVHTSEDHTESWRVLASAKEREIDLDVLAQELVLVWKGTWIEGGSGYVGTVDKTED